jgi:putative aminopeptidase FrvX
MRMKRKNSNSFELLKELSEAAGVSGREDAIREIVLREVRGCVDDVSVDAMGNVITRRGGSSKSPLRVMFAAHMDEIGFYVSYIDDKGFIRLQEVGGFDTRNLFARRVVIHTEKGPLRGTLNPSGKALHVSSPEDRVAYKQISDFFIDTGLPGKKVHDRVRIGDMVTLDADFVTVGDHATGKCLDNRVQVYVGIRALQLMKRPKNDVFGVFTVQEEVGLRGAFPSAYGVDPHVGLALDTTVAGDTPGSAPEQRVTTLGGGAAIKVMDGSVICSREVVDQLTALAKKHKIPHQFEILPRGGTDAGAIQRARSGVKTAAISVPTRYLHTVTETVHISDVEAALNLLCRFLER